MKNIEDVAGLFGSGMNCAQAMLTVFGTRYGIDSAHATKLGRPLGGGLGRLARTCGALTGALLVLGLSTEVEEEGAARKQVFESVQQLFRRFEGIYGTSECKGLLGADMSTEDGMKKISEEKLVSTICPGVMRDTARILEDLLPR